MIEFRISTAIAESDHGHKIVVLSEISCVHFVGLDAILGTGSGRASWSAPPLFILLIIQRLFTPRLSTSRALCKNRQRWWFGSAFDVAARNSASAIRLTCRRIPWYFEAFRASVRRPSAVLGASRFVAGDLRCCCSPALGFQRRRCRSNLRKPRSRSYRPRGRRFRDN